MSQIIDVATWVALIGGLAGITLSIVAIWFTFAVDSRSRRITEQMVQSLQKIESSVERSSADTQGLIKVGWDRMLVGVAPAGSDGKVEGASEQAVDSGIEEVAAGLAEEFRSDLAAEHGSSPSNIDIDTVAQRVSETIQAQLRVNRIEGVSISAQVDAWLNELPKMSHAAYELVRFLGAFGHLTRSQYRQLSVDTRYAGAVSELRRSGALSPMATRSEPKEDQPVYWFSPGTVNNIHMAFDLLNRNYPEERESLRNKLVSIGYIKESSRPGLRGWNIAKIASEGTLLNGEDGGHGKSRSRRIEGSVEPTVDNDQ